MRQFLTRYQDRILYATDFSLREAEPAAAARSLKVIHDRDWAFFSGADRWNTTASRHGALAFPEGVLRKLFRENALRWLPGFRLERSEQNQFPAGLPAAPQKVSTMGASNDDFTKYPRTPHLFGSRGTDDDKHLCESESVAMIADHSLIIEEKLDGTNVGIHFTTSGRLVLQCRGHEITPGMHPQFMNRHNDVRIAG